MGTKHHHPNRTLTEDDIPFLMGLPSSTWLPVAEAAVASNETRVRVTMPLTLALAMWEAVTALALLTGDRVGHGDALWVLPADQTPLAIPSTDLLRALVAAVPTNERGTDAT